MIQRAEAPIHPPKTGRPTIEPSTVADLRIGDVAKRAGVSTRTIRYYQELGLLIPAGASPGGNRRYSEADLARLTRILELRDVMGFDLERIGDILGSEDRLDNLRREARTGPSRARRIEILREAGDINAHLQEQVAEKVHVLEDFATDLERTRQRYRVVAEELGIDLDS